jgi:hypothetical protein
MLRPPQVCSLVVSPESTPLLRKHKAPHSESLTDESPTGRPGGRCCRGRGRGDLSSSPARLCLPGRGHLINQTTKLAAGARTTIITSPHEAASRAIARRIVRIRSDVTATHREILASTRRWQCQQSNLWPVVEASSRRDWSPRSRPSPALLACLLRRPAVWPRVTVTVDHQTLTVWRGGRWCE